MNMPIKTLPFALIPDDAPFSVEQRSWLSGFLASIVVPNAHKVSGLELGGAPAAAAADPLATNDDAPWHDPSLGLSDRMAMAEGRGFAPKLMAAMAQQDCGQCGYNCADYANVIFQGKEARLNLCAPGGKDTNRAVKKLAEELAAAKASGGASAVAVMADEPAALAPTGPVGRCRELPVEAKFLSRRRLTGEGSAKDAWHIEFDLNGTGVDYVVGDSFGVFVKNDIGLVDQIIAMLGVSHITPVRDKTLREVLIEDVSLSPAPDALYELLSYISGGEARVKARALARGEDPDGDAAVLDVLAVLQKFPKAHPHPEAFVDALEPLQPRLYSISSSPKAIEGRISLTVDAVRYVIGKRKRLGVASTYLAERIAPDAPIKVYVQAAHNFALPSDPLVPVIMIGPGTGIAPFMAFLHERAAVRAPGKNWLFFGHQKQATDFFYKDQLNAWKDSGHLTRLSLAWSRDGDQKFYVQDRMREVGASLWQWLAEGAHFYICGDAKRMAKDVEAALVDIIAQHGARSVDEAIAFVSTLKKQGRFQADVY